MLTHKERILDFKLADWKSKYGIDIETLTFRVYSWCVSILNIAYIKGVTYARKGWKEQGDKNLYEDKNNTSLGHGIFKTRYNI